MTLETRPAGPVARVDEKVLRWAELPRLLQEILEHTPRAQWHRIRPILALSPETSRILELVNLVELILPRSSLGVRQWGLSVEARTRKAHELIQSIDEFWAGVDGIEKVLEKIGRSCGIWGSFESKKYPAKAVAAQKVPKPTVKPKVQAASSPPPPPKPSPEPEALPEADFKVDESEGDRDAEGAA